MDKAERLAQIMFEEDEYREENGMELMYHTKEDFEAEKKRKGKRKEISRKAYFLLLHRIYVHTNATGRRIKTKKNIKKILTFSSLSTII